MDKKAYDTYIFDLDGTLYTQRPVRLAMAFQLLSYCFLRPDRLAEVRIIRDFRRLREQRFGTEAGGAFEAEQFRFLAEKYHRTPEEVGRIQRTWMVEKPLPYVRKNGKAAVLSGIRQLQKEGKRIIVYSDYPVKEKLEALELQPDAGFDSNDPLVGCMKPDPAGLKRILEALSLTKETCLYVGDREEKDGACARGAGIDYMDVSEFEKQWKQ